MSIMSFLRRQKPGSASVAKERLQIILAHERSASSAQQADYLPALQRELLAVISKYVSIRPEDILVNLERQENLDVLAVKIELPEKGAEKIGADRMAPAAVPGAGRMPGSAHAGTARVHVTEPTSTTDRLMPTREQIGAE